MGTVLLRAVVSILCLCAAYILLLIVSALLVSGKREYERNSPFYRFLLYSATACCIKLLRIHVHTEGLEELPKSGRFLLVSNHRSNFDPILTWHILKKYDLAFISKPENFKIPIFGRIIRKCCFLPIDRENPRNALQTVEKAARLIERDEVSIGVYPEGTRSRQCVLLPFHNGVFKIAQMANVPIVVAAIEGTEKIHLNCFRRRTDVQLRIVDVMPVEFVQANRTAAIGERMRSKLSGAPAEKRGKEHMAKYTVLYNPHSANGCGAKNAQTLKSALHGDETAFYDMTQVKNYADFFASVPPENRIVLTGGDGTLNRFINDTAGSPISREIYYFAAGSGNDFLRDIQRRKEDGPFPITPYLQDLPEVTVKGSTYKFLNGVGYGIDGYCCEVGDKLRGKSNKPVNYTSIAIKGLLFHYKPTNAVITVDGTTHHYRKVWLAPTMNGRFYGGGMMPTPNQDRLNKERLVSTLVLYGSGKLKTLIVFPGIFKGEHIKHTDITTVLTGHDITVEFDRPTAIQIDGETIPGVSCYHVASGVAVQPQSAAHPVGAAL